MRTLMLCSMIFFLVSTGLSGQIPQIISYQGVLTDAGGSAVADGSYTMSFRLYASESGTTVLWSESQNVVVVNGIFNVLLGKETNLELPFDQTYWLAVTVGEGTELSPRIQLTSSAYSLRARTVADGGVEAASIADGAVTGSKLAESAVIAGANISVNRDQDNNLVISAEVPDGGLLEVISDTTLTGKGTISEPLGLAIHAVSTAYISDSAVTTEKIEDGAVTQEKLDPSISLPPGGAAGGDLSGNFPTPTVSGIRGRGVSDAVPDIDQVLKWDGSSWVPSADANTTFTAGPGLTQAGTEFSVNFAGSGGATTTSRSDHNHFDNFWSGSSATYGLVLSNSGTGDGIRAFAATSNGNIWGALYAVNSGSSPGIYANTGSAGTYAAYFPKSIYAGGTVIGSSIAFIAQNVGSTQLQQGDLVAISGLTAPLLGMSVPLMQVQTVNVSNASATIGVVQSRGVLEMSEREGERFESISMAPGSVGAGEYVFIAVQGMAQVRVGSGESNIQPGDVVVIGQNSQIMAKTASDPARFEIGRALNAYNHSTGLVWVLIGLR